MFKRTLRWLMPLIALLMVVACLTLSPIISSHAAGITPSAPTSAPAPAWYWRP